MQYPINTGKMGSKPHKINAAGWLTQVLRTFSKITKGDSHSGICDEVDHQ